MLFSAIKPIKTYPTQIPNLTPKFNPRMTLQTQLQHALDNKTKPQGSLGRLESIALQMGLIQQSTRPSAQPAELLLFAADHGVYAEGVAPFPQAVTAQMVANILQGGAASSVMARTQGIALTVVDVGVLTEFDAGFGAYPNFVRAKVAAGSANLAREPALSAAQLRQAMQVGADAVARSTAKVLLVGEMGIANTTPASAICAALLNLPAAAVTGPGTGLDAQGVSHKARVIEAALVLHPSRDALEVLRCVGGLEIAAMTGAYLAAAKSGNAGKVLLIDGFIATAALLVATRLSPAVLRHCIFSHCSGEPGHTVVLDALGAQPLLNLGLRLGEGTGALAAYPLLVQACALLAEMASFESAGISAKDAEA